MGRGRRMDGVDVSVRSELAQGDLRCLYLAWLLCAQGGELDDEEEEPPVPPGLGELSASQENFAEFLRIDPHLISIAAEASAPANYVPLFDEAAAWVAKLPMAERNDLLVRFIQGGDDHLAAELRQKIIARSRVPVGALTTDTNITISGTNRERVKVIRKSREFSFDRVSDSLENEVNKNVNSYLLYTFRLLDK